MTTNTVLWIYIGLLIAGGLVGFLKGKSKASIIASVLFAIPLALCAAGYIQVPLFAEILLNGLLLFFLSRYSKSRKFMPNGMMALLSAAALIAILALNWKTLHG